MEPVPEGAPAQSLAGNDFESGINSFAVQVFGLRRTTELLLGLVERIYWYSLLDLPPTWGATTRHKES